MEWTMGPRDTWDRTAAWLRSIPGSLPAAPKSLLVISAHWEATTPTVISSPAPNLLYDYSGFPKSTYELTWPAPGSPSLAARTRELLTAAAIASNEETQRGNDHGVFIPLKVAFPNAEIPTVQLSLKRGLDPREHLAIGRALSPLRDEGVLILGSGMSYHDMRGFMTTQGRDHSIRFDAWLSDVIAKDAETRDEALAHWTDAPSGRACHPREEHLIPLMVTAGAAGEDRGARVFADNVMGVNVSGVRFG
jgi:aromatic ring-opening dioxygenase catalytic subunit (LigB family)